MKKFTFSLHVYYIFVTKVAFDISNIYNKCEIWKISNSYVHKNYQTTYSDSNFVEKVWNDENKKF